jgi:hypothetical protein
MAIEKVVNITVKNNINTATNDVKALEVELKKAGTGAKDFSKELDKSGGKMGIFDQLKTGAQNLIPGLKGAEAGMSSMIVKMWEMCANPLGLIIAGIVVSLKFLYEAFQSSVAGGKEIKAIWAGLQGVFNQGKDAIFGLGRALINVADAAYKFITLDFKGAAESMKKANGEATKSFEQLGNAVDGTTFKIMRNLEKQQQMNDKARKISAVEESKANLLLVKSRDILMDEMSTMKEKKKALAEVTKVESAASAERERIALKDLQIAKVKASTIGGEAEKKAKAQIRELEIAYNVAQTETAQNGIKLSKQKRILAKQEREEGKADADAEKARIKSITDAQKEALKERQRIADEIRKAQLANDMESAKNAIAILKALNESLETPAQKEQREYEEKKAVLEANNLSTELLDADHKLKLQKIEDDYFAAESDKSVKRTTESKAKEDKAKEDDLKDRKAKHDALFGMANDFANLMDSIDQVGIKKNKAGQVIRKGLALVDIAISTATAMGSAVKEARASAAAAQTMFPMIPGIGIAAGIASYASSAAMILGNVAKAKAVLSSGNASSGGGSAGGDGGRPSTPPQFNIVGQNSNNQLAQSIGKSQNRPVEAFVVSGNMTTAQSLDRNRIATATFNS